MSLKDGLVTSFKFNGTSDFAVWNRKLTKEEIEMVWNGGQSYGVMMIWCNFCKVSVDEKDDQNHFHNNEMHASVDLV